MIRRTTVNLTEATDKQVHYLQEAGFGSFTEIVRLAVDRMYQEEKGASKMSYHYHQAVCPHCGEVHEQVGCDLGNCTTAMVTTSEFSNAERLECPVTSRVYFVDFGNRERVRYFDTIEVTITCDDFLVTGIYKDELRISTGAISPDADWAPYTPIWQGGEFRSTRMLYVLRKSGEGWKPQFAIPANTIFNVSARQV